MIDSKSLYEEDMAATEIEAPAAVDNPYEDANSYVDDSAIKKLGDELTEEDKTYLLMK